MADTVIESGKIDSLTADVKTDLNNLTNGTNFWTGQFKSSVGTAAAPGMTFVGDLDSGIYRAAADTIGFAVGGVGKMLMTSAALSPVTSDGLALGTSALMWSDLFLASGAVINFDNGNGTITHSAGTLTFAGVDINLSDKIVQRPVLKDYGETVNAIGSTGGGTQDIDLTLGNVVTATVDTSANTFTFSNPSASGTACSFTFIVTNGGSQTVNWPASVDWAGGSAPTLTTSGRDVLSFFTVDGGTIWYGFVGGMAFA